MRRFNHYISCRTHRAYHDIVQIIVDDMPRTLIVHWVDDCDSSEIGYLGRQTRKMTRTLIPPVHLVPVQIAGLPTVARVCISSLVASSSQRNKNYSPGKKHIGRSHQGSCDEFPQNEREE
jgi:hypothetical protein